MSNTLIHGGQLEAASENYGIPMEEWIDLSTGINPLAYPDISLTQDSLMRMPYQQQAFCHSVRNYYGDYDFLATNGSQQVINVLPMCLNELPIVLPDIGYQEHQAAWAKHGVELIYYPSLDTGRATAFIDELIATGRAFHLLVINPNNPTCCTFSPCTLKRWAKQLSNDAVLIVDEAFADVSPSDSVLAANMTNNMVVLRSFGKFFGLPGLRLGFVFSSPNLLAKISVYVGIWDVNGPAQEIAIRALNDKGWQEKMRKNLVELSRSSHALWRELFKRARDQGHLTSESHQILFSSYVLTRDMAQRLYEELAQREVLLRLYPVDEKQAIIRIGLVDADKDHLIEKLNLIIKQSMRALGLSKSQQASDKQVERQYG